MKILIYLKESNLKPQGGPLAVGYYYHTEIAKRRNSDFDFLGGPADPHSLLPKIEYVMKRILPLSAWNYYKEYRRTIAFKHLLVDAPVDTGVNLNQYDIVHFHQSDQMYRERKGLENYKGIVVYQPHSPIPYGQEQYVHMPKNIKNRIENIEQRLDAMDRYCFDRADYIIFPCPEAEEPYANSWTYFSEIKARKPESFKYVLTGITPAEAKRTRSEVLKELNIPEASFVISYVGRHNYVKGYDILKEVAAKYFKFDDNAYVISAGTESPYTRLVHNRWREIGFTRDAHSYIAASDVFLLPNRVTYFDIVMMEVLSLGKIVIASRTGGNKFFEKNNVRGVLLYDTEEDAISLLRRVKSMSLEEREFLGNSNKDFYTQYLTVPKMYDRYIDIMSEFVGGKN